MTLKFNKIFLVVEVYVRAKLKTNKQTELSDDAENNSVVATAGSNYKNRL